jgi:phage-related holin
VRIVLDTLREIEGIGYFVFKVVGDIAVPKWVVAAGAAFLGYMLPTEAQQSAFWGAIHLVAVDTVTGYLAARHEGQPPRSSKFGRILSKLTAYCALLSVAVTVSRHVPGASAVQGASVTGVLTLVILTEALSILENVKRMGFSLPWGIDAWLAGRLAQPAIVPSAVVAEEAPETPAPHT